MKKSLIAILLLTGLLVVGIIVVLVGGDENRSELADAGEESPFNDVVTGGEQGFPGAGELERLMEQEGGPTARAQYEAYRVYARYPDHSRPLSAKMTDLTNPWKVKNAALPVIADPRLRSESVFRKAIATLKSLGKSEEEIKAELMRGSKIAPRYAFDLNRHTVTADDEMRAELVVASPNGAGQDITISSAVLMSDRRLGPRSLGSVPYERVGAGRYMFTWTPPSDADQYWGSLTLLVKAQIPGIDTEVEILQGFFSSPKAPARFTGNFNERLVDGSLVIEAELDVTRECRYSLQANLFNADTDEPTHWVSADQTLKTGRQTVAFTFYGKIFHDGGHEGRFQMKHLRGTCENLPFPASWIGDPARLKDIENAKPVDEPPLRYIPFNTLTHTTNDYNLGQFSDKEWASAYKTRRLERLRSLAGAL